MALVRYPDWDQRLHQFLLGQVANPFHYGRFDCAIFCADALVAMTGVDVAAPFRGQYLSRKEALAAAKNYCGKATVDHVVAAVAQRHGLLPVAPAYAQRGDVILLNRMRDVSLGIVSLNGREVLAAGRKGFMRVPLSRAKRAWRI
jgi:hypothetical protein